MEEEEEMSYGHTTNYNLPYPNDYTNMADVPMVVQALAEQVDTEMLSVMGNLETILETLDTGSGVE